MTLLALLFLSSLANSASPRLAQDLPFLILKTKLSRSKEPPSLDRIRAFHEAQLSSMNLPQFFVEAERSRTAVVDTMVDVQCRYNDFFRAVQDKSKVDIKTTIRLVMARVADLIGALAYTRLAHEPFDVSPTFKELFKTAAKLVDGFHASIKDCQGQKKVDISPSGTLIVQTEQQFHILRSSLSGLADYWLRCHVSQLPYEKFMPQLRSLWGISMRVYLLFIEVGLFVTAARLAGNPGVGQINCVFFAARARLSSMTGDVVVHNAAHFTLNPALMRLLWDELVAAVASANTLFQEATNLAQRGDVAGSLATTKKHREVLFKSLNVLEELRKF